MYRVETNYSIGDARPSARPDVAPSRRAYRKLPPEVTEVAVSRIRESRKSIAVVSEANGELLSGKGGEEEQFMTIALKQAPELITTQWFNSKEPVSLSGLRGRVVLIEAFQMLCPGCVSHALPQAQTIHKTFNSDDVAVIGLHTVFEHHEAMTPTSLEAFLHEYRIEFPVGVDKPSDPVGIPQTMALYRMQGTPTTILLDRMGRIRKQIFGRQPDLIMGAEIMSLVLESPSEAEYVVAESAAERGRPDMTCDENGCPAP